MALLNPSVEDCETKQKTVIFINSHLRFMKQITLLGIALGVFSTVMGGTQPAFSNQCGMWEAMGIDDVMLASMGCPTRRQMGARGGSVQQTCNMWGCGVNPNMWGSSPNGECNMWGCP